MDKLIDANAAYLVHERAARVFWDKAKSWTAIPVSSTDILGVKYGRIYRSYLVNSVVSYALENGKCPIEAVEKSKVRGGKLHWISRRASVLTNLAGNPEKLVLVKPGDLVKFEGRFFEIARIPGDSDNLDLKPVSVDEG